MTETMGAEREGTGASGQVALTAVLRRWGPALGIMAAIFTASAISSRDLPYFGLWDLVVKKGGHATGYALLGIAFLRGFAAGRRPAGRQVLLAVALAAAYAATDEFHQRFVPGRTPSLADVLLDTVGAAFGTSLRWGVAQLRPPRR